MAWDLKSDRPIYTQLVEQIELMICSGIYPVGSKLPSVRDFAKEAGVNPNTMQRALAKLEEDGLVNTNRTSGKFVTEDRKMIEQVKNKLAKEHIKDFLNKMAELGFDSEDVISGLLKMAEEMRKWAIF